jgi:hypothetical protein
MRNDLNLTTPFRLQTSRGAGRDGAEVHEWRTCSGSEGDDLALFGGNSAAFIWRDREKSREFHYHS